MSRMEKEEVENLKASIKKLEASHKILGEALDTNANVLRIVTEAVNMLCEKAGISYVQVQQAVLDKFKENITGVAVQSKGAGAAVGDSGSEQPNILDATINRTVEGIVNPKGEATRDTFDTGDQSNRDGQVDSPRASGSGTPEVKESEE